MDDKEFYNPWGTWGVLWRTMVFLGGIVLLVYLFSLFNNGGNVNDPVVDNNNDVDTSKIDDPYRGRRNVDPVVDWRDSIPNVHELPSPDDNVIPPIDSTRIVPDPDDSLVSIVRDQIIVFFNSQDLKSDIASFAKQFKAAYPSDNYKIVYYHPVAGTMIIEVPDDQLGKVFNELPNKITGIEFRISKNMIFRSAAVPSDSGFGVPNYDEYFRLIQAYDAWDITQGSEDVIVAIVDSYFDLTNPEIGERYIAPINIPSKTANVFPPPQAPNKRTMGDYCHGSHVAGAAIGGQNNQTGCSGIAPKCKWIPISVADGAGEGFQEIYLLEGILYAIYKGADVINFSIGAYFPPNITKLSPSKQAEIAKRYEMEEESLRNFIYKTAIDHNCVFVTAAGNQNVLLGMDPSKRSSNIINVEAVNGKGIKLDFSNYSKVQEIGLDYKAVAAPGLNVWSCSERRCANLWRSEGYKVSADGSFQEMSGTSMASPIVAGAVALLKSKNKNLTPEQIKKILLMTAKQTDGDPTHRIGATIQIKDALEATSTGEVVNFDDLMRDHSLLVGKWKSTHEIDLADAQTGEKVDESWDYFIFTSPTEGYLECHTVISQKVYRAKLSVTWGTDRINITQHDDAVSADGDKIYKNNYVCKPDANRLMDVNATSQTGGGYNCKFEKVN